MSIIWSSPYPIYGSFRISSAHCRAAYDALTHPRIVDGNFAVYMGMARANVAKIPR